VVRGYTRESFDKIEEVGKKMEEQFDSTKGIISDSTKGIISELAGKWKRYHYQR